MGGILEGLGSKGRGGGIYWSLCACVCICVSLRAKELLKSIYSRENLEGTLFYLNLLTVRRQSLLLPHVSSTLSLFALVALFFFFF